MATVHQYNQDGFYLGETDDFGGPMPNGCFSEAPPATLPDGAPLPADCRYRRLTSGEFELVEDYRGQTGYDAETGAEVEIKAFGPWPNGLVRMPRPGSAYKWDGGQWVYDLRLDNPGPGYEFDEKSQTWIKTRFSVFSFLNLFTLAEKTAIKKAIAENNFEAAAIYDSFVAADYIDLRNQVTIDNVWHLAGEGNRLLTDNRAAEILKGQPR